MSKAPVSPGNSTGPWAASLGWPPARSTRRRRGQDFTRSSNRPAATARRSPAAWRAVSSGAFRDCCWASRKSRLRASNSGRCSGSEEVPMVVGDTPGEVNDARGQRLRGVGRPSGRRACRQRQGCDHAGAEKGTVYSGERIHGGNAGRAGFGSRGLEASSMEQTGRARPRWGRSRGRRGPPHRGRSRHGLRPPGSRGPWPGARGGPRRRCRRRRARRRRRAEKPEAKPVAGRAGLVAAEQVEFRLVERRQVQFAAGHAQLQLPGEGRRQFLQVGFRFGPRDAPVAIGVHRAAFLCRPLVEERQVQGDIDVALPDGQMDAVLNTVCQLLMRRRAEPSTEHQARYQGPRQAARSQPATRSLDAVVHAMLWFPPFTPGRRPRQGSNQR